MRRLDVAPLGVLACAVAAACGGVSHGGHASVGNDGHGGHGPARPASLAPRSEPRGPAAGHSVAPAVAFAADGTVFVAYVEGSRVWVSSSADGGATFAPAVAVNRAAEEIDANGEARPKLALGPAGEVYVAYTRRLDAPYAGVVRFARSTDRGRTFTEPATVLDDPAATGRFEALAIAGDGSITLSWLDKRDRDSALAGGRSYVGAALYCATSRDGGRTFSRNAKVADHVCECCRIATAVPAAGRPTLFWRHVFGANVRDHALAALGPGGEPGEVRRATFEGWEIDGCPHHGGAVAADGARDLILAWYAGGGQAGRGLFAARTTDGGGSFSPPVAISSRPGAGHPSMVATRAGVWLAWLEGRDGTERILVRRSIDRAGSWGEAAVVAASSGQADHPFLHDDRGTPVLAWFTEPEGLRLIRLAPGSAQASAAPYSEVAGGEISGAAGSSLMPAASAWAR